MNSYPLFDQIREERDCLNNLYNLSCEMQRLRQQIPTIHDEGPRKQHEDRLARVSEMYNQEFATNENRMRRYLNRGLQTGIECKTEEDFCLEAWVRQTFGITRNVLFVSNQNTENERTVIMRISQEHGIPLTRVTFEAPSEMDVERESKSEAEQQQRDLEAWNALRDSWRDRKD